MSSTKLPDIESYFNILSSPGFHTQYQIWQKREEILPIKNFKNKFSFYKIGKIFAMFTPRVLTVHNNRLFYYDNDRSESTKGHCDVTNLYSGFFKTQQKYPYLIRLTNYSNISDIYVATKEQFQVLASLIKRHTIQLNFEEEFKLLEKIGQGSFAKVFVAKKKESGKLYAVKMIKKRDSNSIITIQSVKQQKAALQLCQSEYCNKFYQFYEDSNHYYFIIQYIQGKNLMNIIKEQMFLTLQNKITIIRGILEGLEQIHSKGIANRDIKPQNILIDLQTFKPTIIDFGLSLLIDLSISNDQFKRCGTMGYIAPEVMNSNQQHRIRYTPKVDMFSFGIIVHILLLGFNPLKGKTYEQTFQNNKQFNFQLDSKTLNYRYGDYCASFLQGLLQYTSTNRLSAGEALNHPFLNSQMTQGKQPTKTKYSIDFSHQQAKLKHQSPLKKPKKHLQQI